MIVNYVYLHLFSPLHTGGTTQEGNLVGIARESHTNLPYIPSSTIRGRLRASITDPELRVQLFGPELNASSANDSSALSEQASSQEQGDNRPGSSSNQLEQGDIWIGDGSLLWFPAPSLSHGVIWVSCPSLLRRWKRFKPDLPSIPKSTLNSPHYHTNLVSGNQQNGKPVYLKDAIIRKNLCAFPDWKQFIPGDVSNNEGTDQDLGIEAVLLLPDQHCATLIQMSLWRQVKIKLDQHKSVDGGFRYEEAIPPDTLMYFPWGVTDQASNSEPNQKREEREAHLKKLAERYAVPFEAGDLASVSRKLFVKNLLEEGNEILQIGGQESLGRGFVRQFSFNNFSTESKQEEATES